ncbi:MAG: hypothetical protein IPJ89_01000 [Candidatus Iainarchaeum archaeon]|uniref:Uncharacterized protein n=1 Tax=Candidatus Iainarchaeum sp. TaxID=3101447 RepID=A0A7T9DK42_9ARCH|nr:MAG: hypothetical protein IPJ89_01000 [Candidatus Diapherotrites archaeon]
MELNPFTIGFIALAVLAIGAAYYFSPSIFSAPTGLVTGVLEPSNPFSGKLTSTIEKMFRDQPQSYIEQDGRHGLLLPGGASVQFSTSPTTTEQDVVIILNASTAKITSYHAYPEFVQNEFTYVPPEQLAGESPYIRAQYPNGIYLMPVNVK